MGRKESLKFFVENSKKDFSLVEENLHKIILELNASQNKKLNYIEEYDEKNVLQQLNDLKKNSSKGKLFGVPLTIKDSICVKDLETKAGSKILKGYKPLFDATVIKKAREEGAIILAKTTQDEFGFGTFSTNTEKIPKNPFDNERSCGGSSGSSAAFTAYTSRYHASIGESTGGSIACPSSFCGVTSITPTYGLVSRYGLIDYANSLDKIGSIGRNIEDVALLLNVISGEDNFDSTNIGKKFEIEEGSIQKIAIVKNFFENCSDEVKKIVLEKIDKLKEFVKIEEVELPLNSEYALSAYYIIATSEASTNLAKLSGLRYGVQGDVVGKHFDDYFSEIRSNYFSEETKRRIILGTFTRMSGFRDAYYLKALRVRTKLINEFNQQFKKYDLLLTPTMPMVPPKFSEIEKMTPLENFAMDLCTIPANLAGLPHSSCNAGFSKGLPVGLMAIAPHLQEQKLYSFGKVMELE
ncbi:MAG: amidase family protein [Candidatus ainarchaeum sp.]|nr:amidase family protein [Candidatus ainarchaeum sp.]